MHGSSQAIRIPAEYRFEKPDVRIARIGSMVLISPKEEACDLFDLVIGTMSDDFKRLDQGEHERDLAALDPTPAPVRTRVYRMRDSADSAGDTAAKRRRSSTSSASSRAGDEPPLASWLATDHRWTLDASSVGSNTDGSTSSRGLRSSAVSRARSALTARTAPTR